MRILRTWGNARKMAAQLGHRMAWDKGARCFTCAKCGASYRMVGFGALSWMKTGSALDKPCDGR